MKRTEILVTQLVLTALLATYAAAAAAENEVTPINASFHCVYSNKTESMIFDLVAKTDGSLTGSSEIKVAGKTSAAQPFAGRYYFRDQTIFAYTEKMVTKVRPGYTLPSQFNERSEKFAVRWIKEKNWALLLGPAVTNRKVGLKCLETPGK